MLQLHGGFIAKSTYYKLDRSASSPPQAQASMFQLTQCNGTHDNLKQHTLQKNNPAAIEIKIIQYEIKKGNWELEKLPKSVIKESYYKPFMELVPDTIVMGYRRANTQSPANRLKLQLSKFFFGQKPLLE